jgi:hypothetical protein
MIKAMQELSKQNDDLKTQVATLSQTVNQLTKSNGPVTANSASINQNFPNPFTKAHKFHLMYHKAAMQILL